MEHPIVGAGIGMDILALNQVRGPEWTEVHNVYLQYAVDLGLPGLILFLILFCGVFRTARSSRWRTASVPELRNLFLLNEGLEVSLIVFAVAGMFHPVAYHFYFYYIGGLALATRSATDASMGATKVISREIT
jgi:O-antigen ligase